MLSIPKLAWDFDIGSLGVFLHLEGQASQESCPVTGRSVVDQLRAPEG